MIVDSLSKCMAISMGTDKCNDVTEIAIGGMGVVG